MYEFLFLLRNKPMFGQLTISGEHAQDALFFQLVSIQKNARIYSLTKDAKSSGFFTM